VRGERCRGRRLGQGALPLSPSSLSPSEDTHTHTHTHLLGEFTAPDVLDRIVETDAYYKTDAVEGQRHLRVFRHAVAPSVHLVHRFCFE